MLKEIMARRPLFEKGKKNDFHKESVNNSTSSRDLRLNVNHPHHWLKIREK